MQVALVFPPFGDPRAPQLALPSLAAFLRHSGVSVSLHDLNIEAFEDLASAERLAMIGSMLGRLAQKRPSPEVARALVNAERLSETVPPAYAVLRHPDRFFDPTAHASARATLETLLRVVSVASGAVEISLSPIRYDANGFDTARLADLLAATARPEFDLFPEVTAKLLAKLHDQDPVLVGITITNRQQILPGLNLARRLRREGHFVTIGGAVYTKFVDSLRLHPSFFKAFADAVVVYEGETALLSLAHAVENRSDFRGTPNLLFLDGGRVVSTSTHVEDVSSLPTPDFVGLPLDRYFTPYPVLPILTGKGCYFNRCKFCDIPFINHVSKKSYRVRPPERVVNDVHTLNARHGASHFVITDEALSPRLLGTLADTFDARPGKFSFSGYARLEPGFTEMLCRRIAGFGVRKLFFGLESGSQAMLDHMDKGIRVERVSEVLRNCRRAGIDFHLFSIIGLPQETVEQARETVRVLLDNKDNIDAPGSSFDVHPFGLELRTPYFLERQSYGIDIEPMVLSREFSIGLDATEWRNRDGLSSSEVRRLITDEFAPTLRRTFCTWHAGPNPLWPPQEEYAVLYSDKYAGRPFPWRSSLPRDPNVPFLFVLDRSRPVHTGAEAVYLHCVNLTLSLPEGLMRMLLTGRCQTWGEHLREWPDVPSDPGARKYVDELIAIGVLAICLRGLKEEGQW